MSTAFKHLLEIIDRLATNPVSHNTLFQSADDIPIEDQRRLETWAGKSIDQISKILLPSYAKRQISFDPFTESSPTIPNPVVFTPLDDKDAPHIFYSIENSEYGQIIIASTAKGICYLVFFSGEESKALSTLQKQFPGSLITNGKDEHQANALNYLKGNLTIPVQLHVKGTTDQLRIWEALTRVPAGKLVSYGTLAKATRQMAQDIGVAMGDNRIAMLIPCHRVIKATGELGQYHWGARRKQAMIINEAAPEVAGSVVGCK